MNKPASLWCLIFHRGHLIEHYLGLSDPWFSCAKCDSLPITGQFPFRRRK